MNKWGKEMLLQKEEETKLNYEYDEVIELRVKCDTSNDVLK